MNPTLKTILKFALICLVAYASRPVSDAIASHFSQDDNVMENVQPVISGTINDHDYVDLGLSVKWATCNVGASNFTDYGDYYAWGETSPKDDYSWKTYRLCDVSWKTINKYRYGFDNESVLESLDDAATVNWGEKWRMPTIAELKELVEECTWEWNTIDGVNGYKITAKNNNWIFLPAAGRRYSTSISNEVFGYYWSSIVDRNDDYYAYGLRLSSGSKDTYSYFRHFGQNVRPVSDIR